MNDNRFPSAGNPDTFASGIRMAFDELTAEVRKASNELSYLAQQLPKASAQYRQAVLLRYGDLRTVRKNYLMELEKLLLQGSLNRNQNKRVTEYLIVQLKKYSGADDELRAMFSRYSGEPMMELPDPDFSELSEDHAEEDSTETRINDETTPWEKARAEHRENRRYRKKQEQTQQLKRSVKTVYTGLMKVFHPDTETDPERKAEKEEISKQITVAYGKQDFMGLLRLESEFLTNQKQRSGQLNDPQLRPYIKVLKEQKTEIKKQMSQLKSDYGFLFEVVATGSEKPLLQLIKSEKAAIDSAVQGYRARIRILQEADGTELKMLLTVMEEELEMMSDEGA